MTPPLQAEADVEVYRARRGKSAFGVMKLAGHDGEELRKRLTAHTMEGKPVTWLDNIPQGQVMDSPVLAAALTAPSGRWDDRILGVSKMASVPIRSVWVMTANNPQVSGELARRMVPIMLTSPHPDDYAYKLALDDEWLELNRGRNPLPQARA